MFNQIDLSKLLIENGADVNAKDEDDKTPLYIAIYIDEDNNKDKYNDDDNIDSINFTNSIDIIKLLIEKGANINDKNINTNPLFVAVRYNNLKIIRFLIAKGADVNITDKKNDNISVLMITITNRDTILAKLLIEKGANVHEKK